MAEGARLCALAGVKVLVKYSFAAGLQRKDVRSLRAQLNYLQSRINHGDYTCRSVRLTPPQPAARRRSFANTYTQCLLQASSSKVSSDLYTRPPQRCYISPAYTGRQD